MAPSSKNQSPEHNEDQHQKDLRSLIEDSHLDNDENFHIDEGEIPVEKLLEPSRITLRYENLIENAGLKTKMSADVNVEPFEIKVGFREIEFFNALNTKVQDFLKVINSTGDDMIADIMRETEMDLDKKMR